MKFIIGKENLLNGIRIVERATSQKAVQPVLYNILIETLENNKIRLTATDLVLTVITSLDAQIQEQGKITLPAKKLNEIVSKLGNDLVTFEVEEGSTNVSITCQKSKFDIIGISANEYPSEVFNYELDESKCFDVELTPFLKGIRQAGFASASYEVSNLLSGVVCDFSNGILEIASTDGNRLARVREKLKNTISEQSQFIIPSRTLNELLKMGSFIEDENVKICKDKSTIIFKTEKILTISRLLEGQFPRYNQLIPAETPKNAIVNVSQLIAALERVSVMVNDKTSIVKMHFADNTLTLSADTPDAGKSEDQIDIQYTEEELMIAFNYRFVLEALRIIESDDVIIGLNAPLSATVLKPNSEEDFICLIMPVQIR
ncbi:DNA polymerase III subunit beta [bacterium]|nr:DNA polymerase III subunit beta [bacterium]